MTLKSNRRHGPARLLTRPLVAGCLMAAVAAHSADLPAPAWAQVQLSGQINTTMGDALGFDVGAWQGQTFNLTLTLPQVVKASAQVPVDDVPGAVAATWQMAWMDSHLQLGLSETYAVRANQFQGVEAIDDAVVPAGLALAGRPLVAGHGYDAVTVWASELGGRCVNAGSDGICGTNDAAEEWEGMTVTWDHVWDTTEHQGFSGLAFPALQPGGLDLSQGWGAVTIEVWRWRPAGGADGTTLAEASGLVQLAVLQSVPAVPEPASAAMLLGGLALCTAAAARQRRRASLEA